MGSVHAYKHRGGDTTILSVNTAGEATLNPGAVRTAKVNVDGFADLGNVTLVNASQIIVDNGGKAKIRGDDLLLKNASISSRAFDGIDDGNIEIFLTGTLEISEGSTLSSTISGEGKGGSIKVAADGVGSRKYDYNSCDTVRQRQFNLNINSSTVDQS